MRPDKLKFAVFFSLVLSLVVGCGDGGSSSVGYLDLAVTDAAVDNAEEFVVTFISLSLEGLDEEDFQGPFDIPQESREVDLLAYQGNGHAVLVTDLELPAGTYKVRLDADLTFNEDEQMSWIAFDEDSPECLEPPEGVVFADSTCRYPLEIPSEEESGFKPKGEVTIAAGGTSRFTVEFDLRKNVTDPQDDEFYKLKPTGLRLVDDTLVGSVAGTVDAEFLAAECGTAQANVYLFDRTDAVGDFTPEDIHPDNDSYVTSVPLTEETMGEETLYSYLIGFVMPGDYGVALTCEEDDPDAYDGLGFPAGADGVIVYAEEETILDLPLTE